MKRRSLQIVCVLTILASLLTVTVAFAQGEDPGRENPVIQFLSSLTGLTPEEIAAQKDSGYSLGNVARAYLFAELTGGNASEALGQSQGRGWGVMFKNAGLHPGGGGRGLGWMIGRGHAKPDRGNDRPDHPGGGQPDWAGGPPRIPRGDDDLGE